MNYRLVAWNVVWVLALGYAHILIAATPSASSSAPVVGADTVTAKVIPGLTGKLKAMESTFCGDFSDNVLTLILSKGGKTFEEHPFCSSYGTASANVVVDAHGVNYILLD